jgi:MoaA/NifB/PqqE/SkfB family radical SAM enzyme
MSNPYNYNSPLPLKLAATDLSPQQRDLLLHNDSFCIYPWIHIHAYPTGAAYPCCHAEMPCSIGSTRESTLQHIWNDQPMRELRLRMLAGEKSAACTRCYEQEASGFFSGRQSANKHHGHHIGRTDATQEDGSLAGMELTYWDIRFSNLCNLRCRSCGHIFSSQWYQDQARLAGPEWKLANSVLNYAGRDEQDMWTQLEPHLDYVEQIYFAGGEPLLMEEHYRILEELVARKRFDVRLIYNTNFTHTDLKGRSVFDYWRLFDSVSVGASLDASGAAAEYIRKGTVWADVVRNRRQMIAQCPGVDFYISPTLSILNAWSLPDFHREWVSAGLIRAGDLNINILQDPMFYRIDIAPWEYKDQLENRYRDHVEWLKSAGDPLGRATQGWESAITFMNATDNTHLIDSFWRRTNELDHIRNERCLTVLPELGAIR